LEDWRLFIGRFKTWPNVLFAACLVLCTASFSAHADPNYPWNLGPDGINAVAAWEHFGVDGNGVKIAIIDSGVNYNLPDLNQGYLGGYDFCPTGTGTSCSGDDDDPMDVYGHGTEAASAMLGRGDTINGVAPQAQYSALKITNNDSRSRGSILLKALDWTAAQGGVDIIYMGIHSWNNQLAGAFIENNYDSNGVLFIAPTYNIPTEGMPAAYTIVIGVGAHSRYEPQSIMPETGEWADVLGPGEEVPVLSLDGSVANATDPVGVAAAQVAGALALMVDYNNTYHKDYSNSALWATLNQGAVPLNTGDTKEGRGKLDVYNSLLLMANDWFIDCNCQFLDPNFQQDGLPGYFAGGQMNYNVQFFNNIPADFTGHRDVNGYYDSWGWGYYSGLTITVSLRYDGHDNNAILDGNSVYEVNLPAGQSEQFSGNFSLDPNIAPGKIALYAKIVVHSQGVPDYPEAVIKRINCAFADIRSPCGQQADFVADKIVDLRDFAVLASWWLLPCDEYNSWCNGADLVSNGAIDYEDLSAFASYWLCCYP
jgi:subtilisin family serine protease